MAERLRFGDMLVAAKLVTEAQVEEALGAQKELGLRLGETLVRLGYVTEGQMTQVLSNQLSLPWVDLYHVDFSRELLDRIPAEVADEHTIVPVYVREVRREGDTLYLAMTDPLDKRALQAAADACGLPVRAMVAAPTDIRNAIRVYYLGLPPLDEEDDELEPIELDIDDLLEEDDGEARPSHRPSGRGGSPVMPSLPPPAERPSAAFRTLTLLDGTVVKLPIPGGASEEEAPPEERGLTTRDVIHALRARAAGEDVSELLGEDDVESLLAALLSVLLKKGLVADWEFLNEWKKHRASSE